MTLPKGFSINPNAADGKVACPEGAQLDRHSAAGAPARSSPRSAPCDRHRGAAGADPGRPVPGRTEARRTVPSAARGGRLRDAREAARHESNPDPQTGPGHGDHSRICRNRRLQEFDMHVFGSERGLLATPDPLRHLHGRKRIRALERRSSTTRHSTSFLTDRLGSGRDAVPGRAAWPFNPTYGAGSTNPPPAPLRRSAFRSTGTTATRI